MEAMGLLGAQEAMVVLGTPEALVDRAPWPWPRHLAWPPRPGLYSPPPKKILGGNLWGTGALQGYPQEQEPFLG